MFNAYFWHGLKAEYLLFECLQDFTGGVRCFFLGCYCYLSDISDEKTRTRRFNFLDAVYNIGFMGSYVTWYFTPISSWLCEICKSINNFQWNIINHTDWIGSQSLSEEHSGFPAHLWDFHGLCSLSHDLGDIWTFGLPNDETDRQQPRRCWNWKVQCSRGEGILQVYHKHVWYQEYQEGIQCDIQEALFQYSTFSAHSGLKLYTICCHDYWKGFAVIPIYQGGKMFIKFLQNKYVNVLLCYHVIAGRSLVGQQKTWPCMRWYSVSWGSWHNTLQCQC